MHPPDRTHRSKEEPVTRLRDLLAGPLPGNTAHRTALPANYGPRALPPGAKVSRAAVLLALHPDRSGQRIIFPLVRRPESMLRHAGQVGLPGGERGEGEDASACAKREAWEEIGIDPASVEELGRLTPIVIPVSLYQVETIVGWLARTPTLRAQEAEVLRIIHGDPDRLAEEGPTCWVEREREGEILRFPAYRIQGETVWGATALILAEFLTVWRHVRGLTQPPTGSGEMHR